MSGGTTEIKDDVCQECHNGLVCLEWARSGYIARCVHWEYFKENYIDGNKKIIGDETEDSVSENKYPDKCPITQAPLFMEIEHPKLGLVPIYGGPPHDSYTFPEIDNEGYFFRYRYDHDEGCWDDFLDIIGNAFDIVGELIEKNADISGKLEQVTHIANTALEDVLRFKRERDELLKKVEQLEAVAVAAKEALSHDYITPELHESLRSLKEDVAMKELGNLTKVTHEQHSEIHQFKKESIYAELGRLVSKGANEVMPHTACRGVYQSDHCKDINNDPYGCVLKYYCPKHAELLNK